MAEKLIGTDINQVKITSLYHIQGQPQVIETLKVHMEAYFKTRSSCDNANLSLGPIIFTGPCGIGKTMTAKALHAELGNLKLFDINGETLNEKSELYSMLIHADSDSTIFVDESQALNKKTQHILLTAISEKKLYIPTGMVSSYRYVIDLPNVTWIFATTHEYLLQDALRSRMRIYCRFNYYSVADLVEIIRQRADALNWQYESEEVLKIIAERAKGIPRIALNTNLQMCWNVAKSQDHNAIMLEDVHKAFYHLQIDELGLDKLDQSYLAVLLEYGPAQLNVLSSKLSLPTHTIQRVLEPYLIKEGFIIKEKSSLRVLTDKGRKHIENSLQIFE